MGKREPKGKGKGRVLKPTSKKTLTTVCRRRPEKRGLESQKEEKSRRPSPAEDPGRTEPDAVAAGYKKDRCDEISNGVKSDAATQHKADRETVLVAPKHKADREPMSKPGFLHVAMAPLCSESDKLGKHRVR